MKAQRSARKAGLVSVLLLALVVVGCGKSSVRGGQATTPDAAPRVTWYYAQLRRCDGEGVCRLFTARFDAEGKLDRRYGSRPSKVIHPGTLQVRMRASDASAPGDRTPPPRGALVVSGERVLAVNLLPHGIRTVGWGADGTIDRRYGVEGFGLGQLRDLRHTILESELLDIVALPDDSVVGLVGTDDELLIMVRIGADGRVVRGFSDNGVASMHHPGFGAQQGRLSPWLGGVRVVATRTENGSLWLLDLRADGKVRHHRRLLGGPGEIVTVEALGTDAAGDSVVILHRGAPRTTNDNVRRGRVAMRIDRYGNTDDSFGAGGSMELFSGQDVLGPVSIVHDDMGTLFAARTCVDSLLNVEVVRLDAAGRLDRSWGTDGTLRRELDAPCGDGEEREGMVTVPLNLYRIGERALLVGQFEADGPPAAMIAQAGGITPAV